MENNFVQALEKVCKQQADMFASKMEVMEIFYRNSVKDTNDKLCKILETITTLVKPSNTETLNMPNLLVRYIALKMKTIH